jgi:hypothetical protein
VKVFNISDVETKQLKQRGLVSHSVVIGKQLLAPGASADVPDDVVQHKLEGLNELVEFGVIALNTPPRGYAAKAPEAEPAKEEEKPVMSMRSKSGKNKGG